MLWWIGQSATSADEDAAAARTAVSDDDDSAINFELELWWYEFCDF